MGLFIVPDIMQCLCMVAYFQLGQVQRHGTSYFFRCDLQHTAGRIGCSTRRIAHGQIRKAYSPAYYRIRLIGTVKVRYGFIP